VNHVRVTVHDVAKHAGVSPITVSRVVNERSCVRPETRRRVQESVSQLGYVPNRLARALIQGRTGALGLIVPDVSTPTFALVVRDVEDAAWRAGYHVILCNTQGNLKRELGYLEDMVALQVEGVLIAPVSDRSRRQLRALSRNGVPFVLIDCSRNEARADRGGLDGFAGACELIDQLRTRSMHPL
jgi:LacI family transcriptional regulator